MRIKLLNSLFFFLGALILISDAIYNGYPIIYHDLSTYVANGFDLETPFDRPITYCLFVRLFSLNGFSLWTVILAQAYLVSYLIFSLMKLLFGKDTNRWLILACIAFLSFFTGLSWTVSQVMPDIFTAISIIIVAILLVGKLSRNEQILFYSLFLISTAMHLSHISFNIVLISFLFIMKMMKIKGIDQYLNYKIPLILLGITAIAFSTMLSASAKSKHVFFMGAMVEHGIVKVFLEDNCEQTHFKLCEYKDILPKRAFQFVWEEDSPLYKIGGWKAAEEEFNEIIFETLTRPKYIGLHIQSSFLATLEQLKSFKINDSNGVFLEGSLPYDRMERYLPRELTMYRSSKQMNDQFGFTDGLNLLFNLIVVISLLILAWLLLSGKVYTGPFAMLLVLFLFGILLNAWVSGTFANAINRLGCKMIWLIPFASFIGMIQYYRIRLNKIKTKA